MNNMRKYKMIDPTKMNILKTIFFGYTDQDDVKQTNSNKPYKYSKPSKIRKIHNIHKKKFETTYYIQNPMYE